MDTVSLDLRNKPRGWKGSRKVLREGSPRIGDQEMARKMNI